MMQIRYVRRGGGSFDLYTILVFIKLHQTNKQFTKKTERRKKGKEKKKAVRNKAREKMEIKAKDQKVLKKKRDSEKF